jgi:hypothetical protein
MSSASSSIAPVPGISSTPGAGLGAGVSLAGVCRLDPATGAAPRVLRLLAARSRFCSSFLRSASLTPSFAFREKSFGFSGIANARRPACSRCASFAFHQR